jgi:hypothetical protein
MANASIIYKEEAGSIHKTSAKILQKKSYNGWTYWHVKRDNSLISIDKLRYDYEKKYLRLNI